MVPVFWSVYKSIVHVVILYSCSTVHVCILMCATSVHCTFLPKEYKGIDLSWQQRYSQMTPLFAASLASQPGQTQTDSGFGASVETGMLRATQQSLAFTPTQGIPYTGLYSHFECTKFYWCTIAMCCCFVMYITQAPLIDRGRWLQLDGSLHPITGAHLHDGLCWSQSDWDWCRDTVLSPFQNETTQKTPQSSAAWRWLWERPT